MSARSRRASRRTRQATRVARSNRLLESPTLITRRFSGPTRRPTGDERHVEPGTNQWRTPARDPRVLDTVDRCVRCRALGRLPVIRVMCRLRLIPVPRPTPAAARSFRIRSLSTVSMSSSAAPPTARRTLTSPEHPWSSWRRSATSAPSTTSMPSTLPRSSPTCSTPTAVRTRGLRHRRRHRRRARPLTSATADPPVALHRVGPVHRHGGAHADRLAVRARSRRERGL